MVLHCNVPLSTKGNAVPWLSSTASIWCRRVVYWKGELVFLDWTVYRDCPSFDDTYSWYCVLLTCKRVTVDVATASSMQSLLSRVTSPGKSLRKGLRFLHITSAKLFACFLSAFCALSRISWFGRSTDSSFSSRYLPSNWCKILVVSGSESIQRLKTKQRKLY